jgi:phage terminase large subunit-like protein
VAGAVVSPPLVADDRSLAEKLVAPFANLPAEERVAAFDALMAELDPQQAAFLASWEGQARPSQRITADPEHPFHLVTGGRGSGKSRTGAETICDRIEADELHHGAFISRTPGDVRRVMIEGVSGLNACAERRGIQVNHRPSLAQIEIVDGGTISTYSAQEPDSLRGPEHDTVWGDEFAAWPPIRDAMGNTAFTNAVFGLRSTASVALGLFTTTPKAVESVKEALKNETGLWRAVRMTTQANAANLAPGFMRTLHLMFGGTRLFAQEALGEYVEDIPGALWTTAALEATRLHLDAGATWRDHLDERLPWRWVSCDPSVAADGGGDECGIVAGGVGLDRRLYILADVGGHLAPRDWAARAIATYYDVGASCIVAEGNQGGALISEVVHGIDPTVPVEIVHARNSKRARAEPIAALWHAEVGDEPLASIVGSLPELEAELTSWDAETSRVSPNRLDAMVWLGHKALRHLYEPEASWSSTGSVRRLPV